MKLTQLQRRFIFDSFFKNEHYAGWKNIAWALLETGYCFVPGYACIWIGGIGNFISVEKAPEAVGCVRYTFDESFFESAWFKEVQSAEKEAIQEKINELQTSLNEISDL